MEKSANTAVSFVLPALMICSAACDVYDASLSRHLEDSRRSRESTQTSADASTGDSIDDAGEAPSAEDCGNGVVDPSESCDVAISSGHAGACPDGCSGRDGCTQRVVVGSQCSARCVEVEITQVIAGDGCCPSEATAELDDDCASTCGNGVIERGERCDPPGTCAQKQACVTTEACQRARFTGDPEQCTAACEIESIHACVRGDGCCPPGCTADTDDDCHSPEPVCDSGCMTPDGVGSVDAGSPDAGSECQVTHPGAACEACDCERCEAEALGCSTLPERDAERCEALSRCSVKAKCTGIDCYCGNLNADACSVLATGPCVSEIRALGGSRNLSQLISISGMEDTGLGRWIKLTSCRMSKCARMCDL